MVSMNSDSECPDSTCLTYPEILSKIFVCLFNKRDITLSKVTRGGSTWIESYLDNSNKQFALDKISDIHEI